jgi:hypothetical protein
MLPLKTTCITFNRSNTKTNKVKITHEAKHDKQVKMDIQKKKAKIPGIHYYSLSLSLSLSLLLLIMLARNRDCLNGATCLLTSCCIGEPQFSLSLSPHHVGSESGLSEWSDMSTHELLYW